MGTTKIELELDLNTHLGKYITYDADGEPISEPMTLEDVVIGLAANKLVEKLTASVSARYGEPKDPVMALRSKLADVADTLAEEKVAVLVEQAFDQIMHRTDDAGRIVLSEKIRDTVVKAVEDAVQLRVPARDSYSRSKSVLEALVEKEVAGVVEREVKDEIESAKKKVRADVAQRAGDAIAKSLEAGR